MKNIKELRNETIELYDDLRNKKISKARAKELNNTIGKILSSVKVELDNNKIMKEQNKIEFLYYDRDQE